MRPNNHVGAAVERSDGNILVASRCNPDIGAAAHIVEENVAIGLDRDRAVGVDVAAGQIPDQNAGSCVDVDVAGCTDRREIDRAIAGHINIAAASGVEGESRGIDRDITAGNAGETEITCGAGIDVARSHHPTAGEISARCGGDQISARLQITTVNATTCGQRHASTARSAGEIDIAAGVDREGPALRIKVAKTDIAGGVIIDRPPNHQVAGTGDITCGCADRQIAADIAVVEIDGGSLKDMGATEQRADICGPRCEDIAAAGIHRAYGDIHSVNIDDIGSLNHARNGNIPSGIQHHPVEHAAGCIGRNCAATGDIATGIDLNIASGQGAEGNRSRRVREQSAGHGDIGQGNVGRGVGGEINARALHDMSAAGHIPDRNRAGCQDVAIVGSECPDCHIPAVDIHDINRPNRAGNGDVAAGIQNNTVEHAAGRIG